MPNHPIGVFDSGVGGLTVYRALKEALPNEEFIYLGDMARLPYGTKSPETIACYAEQVTRRLVQEGIKLLVVACNTASALGLDRIKKTFPDLPAFGVVDAGAQAAVMASQNKKIVVLATESTVCSGAYESSIKALNPAVEVQSIACNLLVGLAEEGWGDSAESSQVIARYLRQVDLVDYDTLVLGCTHFPILLPALQKVVPEHVHIVDSAQTIAQHVSAYLTDISMAHQAGSDSSLSSLSHFMITDGLERFERIARAFLPQQTFERIDLVDL